MFTLILFKPDCVRRGLVGECLARFERRGFRVAAIRLVDPAEQNDRLLAHYREHVREPFFERLMEMMTMGQIVACALQGDNVVAEARRLAGPYKEPIPGTIRGDFATSPMDNVVHTSSSEMAAQHELGVWFPRLCR